MMVVLHAESASLCNSLQLVVWQKRKHSSRHTKCIKELIVRIVHPIDTKHSFEATLVERSVVSHQRQTLNQRFYLSPNIWKNGSVVCVFVSQPMNSPTPIIVVVRLRLNEGIERIDNLAIPDDNDTHRTNRTPFIIGRLKIYRRKVSHCLYPFTFFCPTTACFNHFANISL